MKTIIKLAISLALVLYMHVSLISLHFLRFLCASREANCCHKVSFLLSYVFRFNFCMQLEDTMHDIVISFVMQFCVPPFLGGLVGMGCRFSTGISMGESF